MHEASIALSLVDVVMARAIEAGARRVVRVTVEVGALSGVLPAALASAFKVAAGREALLRSAVLDLRPMAVTLFCPACECERPAQAVDRLKCTQCGAASNQVIHGRELDVAAMEIE